MRVLALLIVLMAGCTASADPSMVLHFTLVADTDESREGYPGPHCGTAQLRDDHLRVEHSALREAGGGRDGLLVVLPRLEGSWATTGSEGYPRGLPADVDTGIPDTPPWARIGWEDGPTVDGQAVTLPHAWTVQGDGWHVEAVLDEAPSRIRTFRMGSCA